MMARMAMLDMAEVLRFVMSKTPHEWLHECCFC
jgi:hypothetical protein